MKASELRIGNIVSFYGNSIPFSIEEINTINHAGWVDGYVMNGMDKTAINCLKPIPLTEEWLLKLGFRQNVTFIGIEFVCGMFLVFRAGCIQMESTHSKILRFDGCKYVHQLQNLYFALTQEELTIK